MGWLSLLAPWSPVVQGGQRKVGYRWKLVQSEQQPRRCLAQVTWEEKPRIPYRWQSQESGERYRSWWVCDSPSGLGHQF
jgi:hypothetical protein